MPTWGKLANTVALLCLLSACVNYREAADTAYLKEDWDRSVRYYTTALRKAAEPAEIQHIKQRLAESKQAGAQYHLTQAHNALGIQDGERALQHAQKAHDYAPTEDSRRLVEQLTIQERDRSLALGQAALERQAWTDAIAHFEKSLQVSHSPQAEALLAEAKKQKWEQDKAKYYASYQEAKAQLDQRQWQSAINLYRKAHALGSTERSIREAEFAALMLDAERQAAMVPQSIGYAKMAKASFDKALAFGIDSDYVAERIRDVDVNNFQITVHGVVVLPFKPNSNNPWDGVASNQINGAAWLTQLGQFLGPGGALTSELGQAVLSVANTGIAAPDCYIEVYVDNQKFGGKYTTINHDAYLPQWELSILFSNIRYSDNRVISFVVKDADDLDADDNVGSYQVRLSDLLVKEGVQSIPLFSRHGDLQASGLLSITLSAEKL